MNVCIRDLTGQRFGNWKVLSLAVRRYRRGATWLCECQCATRTRKVRSSQCLVRGRGNQSCGCLDNKKLRPFESLYNRLVYNGKRGSGRKVLFTYEQFVRFTKIAVCHYCWTAIPWKPYNTSWNQGGSAAYYLDRKNNTLPYTVRNCVVCCTRCNRAKREFFTYKDWFTMTACFRRQQ